MDGQLRSESVDNFARKMHDEVCEFMDDDVVDNERGGFHQAPIEADVVVYGAGTPAVHVIDNPNLVKIHAEFSGQAFHPWDDRAFGPLDVPISQSFLALNGVGFGYEETLFEPDFALAGFDYFNAVLAPQVERRFAADKFFPRRMGSVPVLLRMSCLRIDP